MEAQKNVQVYNITADGINAGMSVPQQRVPVKETPGIKTGMPERSGSGPVRVGKLLEPLRQIINHPDRNRLIAELFRDYR
ncbi:hypothetical protein [Dysgonomonas termitidis]|uniref:Uncharacterized protein n=1 Tax=Dysgonomonas termitidis TaxID=1516126 RepID=A0ABV9L486_9BACT